MFQLECEYETTDEEERFFTSECSSNHFRLTLSSSLFINFSDFCRFLIATHYTKFSSPLFAVNFAALIWVLFPKLPLVSLIHRTIKIRCNIFRLLSSLESWNVTLADPSSTSPFFPIRSLLMLARLLSLFTATSSSIQDHANRALSTFHSYSFKISSSTST